MFVGVYFIGQKLGIGISVLLAQIVIGAFIYGILCICYFYFTNDQIILKMLHKTKRVRWFDIYFLRNILSDNGV